MKFTSSPRGAAVRIRRLAVVTLVHALVVAAALSAADVPKGTIVENVASLRDASQTYSLYLPSAFDPSKKAPMLLILDPRGRSVKSAELFRAAAQELGWVILSSNQSRSDEAVDPNGRVLATLLPEALERWSADPKRIYLAGFSGTAIVSWAFGIANGGVAGIVGAGGRLIDEVPPGKFSFASYGFAGELDFNNRDMRAIEAILEQSASARPHRFEQFVGDHGWMDAALARDALVWMEVVAMKEGRRERDERLIARALADDLAAAVRLEAAERLLEASRRYRAIVRTYDGLADVAAARSAAERLAGNPAVKQEATEESRWDAFEANYLRETLASVGSIFAAMRAEDAVPTAARLSRELRVPDLKRRASRAGAEGRAARRILETVHVQTGYYLMRQLFAKQDYRLAIATLGVAAEIHPDRWPVEYNLAAAHARLKDRRRALGHLERAVTLGLKDPKQILDDDDFESLRDDRRFQQLVARLQQPAG